MHLSIAYFEGLNCKKEKLIFPIVNLNCFSNFLVALNDCATAVVVHRCCKLVTDCGPHSGARQCCEPHRRQHGNGERKLERPSQGGTDDCKDTSPKVCR